MKIQQHEIQPRNHRSRQLGWIVLIALLLLVVSIVLVIVNNRLKGSTLPDGDAALTGRPVETELVSTPDSLTLPAQVEETLIPDSTKPDANLLAPTVVLPTPHPWDGKSRVTILVMGLDYADWEGTDRVGPARSDTMILLTVDPVGGTAGMLSIPRDLWVSIPGIEGYQKINTAHRFGELYKLPGGGPGLALRTVEQLLGVPINFYAVIDFRAFEDFIDELGGIEVDVPSEIKVDPIGPGNTVVLEPGLQLLDGPTALAYARNRQTEGDETDRANRQQQVILAIRDRVLGLNRLPMLVYKSPLLYAKLKQGIQTNMTIEQAIQLAWLGREIPPEKIRRAVIGDSDVIIDKAPDGQDIFWPIPERIQALRDEVFTSATPGPSQAMTNAELIAAEAARITLVDESGDPALVEATGKYLQEMGLDVTATVPGEKSRTLTRLVDHAGNPYTLRALIDLLHVAPSEIYIQIDPTAGTDMTVYLGQDWKDNNPLQP